MVSDSASTLPSRTFRLPNQRWKIFEAQPERAAELADVMELSPLLAQVLLNRGYESLDGARVFLEPDSETLPTPLEAFGGDLEISLALLQEAIAAGVQIAICGDYDADGMTSTALLLRALRYLGGEVDYAIPSRMTDGYGINSRIVKDLHERGVGLILTVDNGIAACEPIELARELEIDIIVTDHHDLPDDLPLANAILNPKLLPETSPYRGMAGVGVAYLLAIELGRVLDKADGLIAPMRELLTLGTIADLAPLTGINRRWVKQGLRQLPDSEIAGIQALIQVSGANDGNQTMKPDAIGFRLGPRINAVGRIGDPQVAIELLTTDDPGIALERAMQCEQINQQRREMCTQIEAEAIAWCEASGMDLSRERVLVVVQPDWHHGVIGIVASRLVERYGVPVFIGTYEDEAGDKIRGSARSIPEFNVFEALQFCDDLLGKYGGHRAAGGFSLAAENLDGFRSRLSTFANQCLEPEHLKPAVSIDAIANLAQIDGHLYREIDRLHPCGIANDPPVFWTPNVRVLEQKTVGQNHLKLTVASDSTPNPQSAIAWRWGEYCPLPSRVDLAYKLRENHFNGQTSIDLEVVGVRLPSGDVSMLEVLEETTLPKIEVDRAMPEMETPEMEETVAIAEPPPTPKPSPSLPIESDRSSLEMEAPEMEETVAIAEPPSHPKPAPPPTATATRHASFEYQGRQYRCGLYPSAAKTELRIRNDRAQVLVVEKGKKIGLLGKQRDSAREVDVSAPHFFNLIKAAMRSLELG
ncbi:MAG: single-stranded-DNA-specific exonuclease RecJ [Cyanobacteriota bacterium]|nr:single-stranded-DNA-specific exonuclease RecJ [Cyanobacteriota bacterium]